MPAGRFQAFADLHPGCKNEVIFHTTNDFGIRLLLLIAGATQKELATYVRNLKNENQTLRSKLPKRVLVTEQERAKLVKFGSQLGGALNELVTIVHPNTLRRWIRESKNPKEDSTKTPTQKGRPKTKEEICELIVKLGRENASGYTRILGELQKLGVQAVSRNTVKNILKEHGLGPGPQRSAGTWDKFLKVRAATLWQCDFYTMKVLTIKGHRDLFLLVFLRVGTRHVFIAPSTFHPNDAWVTEQAEAFLRHADQSDLGVKIVMHDRDTKFTAAFDQKLRNADNKVRKTAYRSPNTNAYVERFIQTLQQESLDYFIVFGQQHMDILVSELVAHYHEERPHQGMDNDVLVAAVPATTTAKDEKPPPDVVPVSQIACRERLGGVLKHYYRKAA